MRMWKLRTLVCTGVLSAIAAAPLRADLAPGDAQYKTDATVAAFLPKYTIGLPSYFTAANQVGYLQDVLVGFGPPGHVFTGLMTSTVYRDPNTGFLTFDYVLSADARNTRAMVRAGLGGAWKGVTIFEVGADGSGTSGGMDPAPEWTDGDPLSIERSDDEEEHPAFQLRGAGFMGTTLGASNVSSHIWFKTNATHFAEADADIMDTFVRAETFILAPAVPEPGTALLGLIGIGGLGILRRRARPMA